jgi:hypothetical protein
MHKSEIIVIHSSQEDINHTSHHWTQASYIFYNIPWATLVGQITEENTLSKIGARIKVSSQDGKHMHYQ